MDEQQINQDKLLKKINRRSRFTQFLAWLALFFTAVGIAAGYKNWLRIHEKAKAGLKGVAEIRQEMPEFAKKDKVNLLEKEINENFKDNKAHLDSAMKELRNIQDSTQHIAETVYVQVEELTKKQSEVKIQTPSIQDWSLGEVHFLLQTAVQRFDLNQDKKGAIAAFKLADSLLLERGSIELLPVRKQISQDIAAINQYDNVDKRKLSQTIDNLLNQLKPKEVDADKKAVNIELIPSNTEGIASNISEEKTQKDNKKDSIVSKVKKTINNAVLIKKYDKPLPEEMDDNARQRLYQLLSLRFETLRIMLLQGDDLNYQRQLTRIQTLIKSYYPTDENNQLQKQLIVLSEQNLSPVIPNVSKSLRLLENIMKSIELNKNTAKTGQ